MELKKKHDKALEDLFDTGIDNEDDAKMDEAASDGSSDGSDESKGDKGSGLGSADNENELLDGEDDEFA